MEWGHGVSRRSRILILVGSLMLGLLYVLPLWRIRLEAPQYPEGLGMEIRVNTIVGEKPHDLQNINGLNHYIGMKRIEPDSIAELKWMPWIVAVLMLSGVITAAAGRRNGLLAWSSAFALIAIVGMVDFWRWEYDYGHNLDLETASIKIPGQTYQPPLIGSKKLLNFTSHSWPASGGWIAIAVLLTGVGVSVIELRRRPGSGRPSPRLDTDLLRPPGPRVSRRSRTGSRRRSLTTSNR
jgi:hypothetical protein